MALRLHVINNSRCLCGSAIESPKHYFLECPIYAGPRQNLITTINNLTACNININILLFGDKELSYIQNLQIFEAVHKYIKETNRFTK